MAACSTRRIPTFGEKTREETRAESLSGHLGAVKTTIQDAEQVTDVFDEHAYDDVRFLDEGRRRRRL